MPRFVVTYVDSDSDCKARIIQDDEMKFPFGVDERMVSEDCETIFSIISLPDNFDPMIVIDDKDINDAN